MARITGKPKTQAARRVPEERPRDLSRPSEDRRERLLRTFKTEIWPLIPKGELGRRLTRQEEDAILGYGPDGV